MKLTFLKKLAYTNTCKFYRDLNSQLSYITAYDIDDEVIDIEDAIYSK
jgi:hypothetical protein